jgi:hypothetical protein
LQGLPRRPLDQVIDTADYDESPRPQINGGVDEAEVVPPGMLGLRRGIDYLNEGLPAVEIPIKSS